MQKAGDKKDITGLEAIEKIKQLADGQICHMATLLAPCDLETRPMSTQLIDDDGNIWFMSHKESKKNQQIAANDAVTLFYSNTSKQEYLSIKGKAIILRDENKIKDFWNPFLNAWFQDVHDPNITLIKIKPTDGYYWDTKHGVMVALFKMAAAAITGNPDDDGIEGNLKLGKSI